MPQRAEEKERATGLEKQWAEKEQGEYPGVPPSRLEFYSSFGSTQNPLIFCWLGHPIAEFETNIINLINTVTF